jgi:hypothetical protein
MTAGEQNPATQDCYSKRFHQFSLAHPVRENSCAGATFCGMQFD